MAASVREAFIPPNSGKVVAVVFQDGLGNTTRPDTVTGLPTVTVNGSPVTVTRTLHQPNLERYPWPPVVHVFLESAVPEGATVTLSAASGWVVCVDGTVGAITNQAVTNYVGGHVFPDAPPSDRAMRVGVNLSSMGGYYQGCGSLYNNYMFGAGTNGDGRDTCDANGFPLADQVFRFPVRCAGGYSNGSTVLRSGDDVPAGRYVQTYKCTSHWKLTNWTAYGDRGETFTNVTANYQAAVDAWEAANPGWHARVWDVTCDPAFNGPILAWIRDSGAWAAVEGWGLYGPPVVDPDDPIACLADMPKFDARWVDRLTGFDTIRFMGAVTVNNASVRDYSDFGRPGQARYFLAPQNESVNLITNAEHDDSGFWPDDFYKFKLTTASPHGLKEGFFVTMLGTSGKAVMTLSDDSLSDLVGWIAPIHVISATQFSFASPSGVDPPPQAVSFALAGDSNVYPARLTAPGMPPEDCVALCNETGCNLHFCVPYSLTDAAAEELFAMIAADLRVDLKLHLELTNEPWNPGLGFTQRIGMIGMGHDLDIVPAWMIQGSRPYSSGSAQYAFYCHRAGQFGVMARAAFVAEGRNPTQVVRLMGSQHANPNMTGLIARYCAENDITFDEIALAPYTSMQQWNSPGFDYTTLTVDELVDVFLGNVKSLERSYWEFIHGREPVPPFTRGGHIEAIEYYGLDADAIGFSAYECALAYGGFAGTPALQALQSIAVNYHPGMREVAIGYATVLEAAGYRRCNYFAFNHDRFDEWPDHDVASNFMLFETPRQVAGRGAGNLAGITDGGGLPAVPDDLGALECPVAHGWLAYAGATAPDPEPDPPPSSPRGVRRPWRGGRSALRRR